MHNMVHRVGIALRSEDFQLPRPNAKQTVVQQEGAALQKTRERDEGAVLGVFGAKRGSKRETLRTRLGCTVCLEQNRSTMQHKTH